MREVEYTIVQTWFLNKSLAEILPLFSKISAFGHSIYESHRTRVYGWCIFIATTPNGVLIAAIDASQKLDNQLLLD